MGVGEGVSNGSTDILSCPLTALLDILPEFAAGFVTDDDVDDAVPETLHWENTSSGVLQGEINLLGVDDRVQAVCRRGDPGDQHDEEEEQCNGSHDLQSVVGIA